MAAPPAFGLKLPRLSNTLSWPRIAEAPQIARGLFNQTAEQIWTAHMTELEVWAEANRKDARRDAFAFWALKAPAIVASASAGVWAHYQWTTVSLMAGAIASFCVIVDGIQPRGMLRNTHLRAFHDLRILMSHMTSRLRASSGEPEAIVRAIIGESESERERIADYIRDAETALKYSDKI